MIRQLIFQVFQAQIRPYGMLPMILTQAELKIFMVRIHLELSSKLLTGVTNNLVL
jgi:hypothetical protein